MAELELSSKENGEVNMNLWITVAYRTLSFRSKQEIGD